MSQKFETNTHTPQNNELSTNVRNLAALARETEEYELDIQKKTQLLFEEIMKIHPTKHD